MANVEKDDIVSDIGKRIRDRRNKLKLTQEMLEEKAGLGAKYGSVIETGSKNMQIGTFAKICDVLELDYDFAITGNTANQIAFDIAKRLANYSEEEIAIFLNFMDTFIKR